MQYRELKTEVFQAFREVGNIIIFCLQVEESLVRTQNNLVLSFIRHFRFNILLLNCLRNFFLAVR